MQHALPKGAALHCLRVWVGSGRRFYGGRGVRPMLDGVALGRTAGELAAVGCARMAGAGAFPLPIPHAQKVSPLSGTPGEGRIPRSRAEAVCSGCLSNVVSPGPSSGFETIGRAATKCYFQ